MVIMSIIKYSQYFTACIATKQEACDVYCLSSLQPIDMLLITPQVHTLGNSHLL